MVPTQSPARIAPASGRDCDIVQMIEAGEAARAFELLARRYETKVFRLCVAMLRNSEAAQDVAQESLIRIWRALPRYDGRAALSTWIYAITRNRCLTALKQAPAALSLSDEAVMDEVHAIAGPRVDVEEAAQMSGIVQRLVGELPESAQRVIRLYYFEDRAVAEVALMLGQPEGTVKTHLHRARSALLQKLEALGLGDPGAWQTGA